MPLIDHYHLWCISIFFACDNSSVLFSSINPVGCYSSYQIAVNATKNIQGLDFIGSRLELLPISKIPDFLLKNINKIPQIKFPK